MSTKHVRTGADVAQVQGERAGRMRIVRKRRNTNRCGLHFCLWLRVASVGRSSVEVLEVRGQGRAVGRLAAVVHALEGLTWDGKGSRKAQLLEAAWVAIRAYEDHAKTMRERTMG